MGSLRRRSAASSSECRAASSCSRSLTFSSAGLLCSVHALARRPEALRRPPSGAPGPRPAPAHPPTHLARRPRGHLFVVETPRPGAAHGTDSSQPVRPVRPSQPVRPRRLVRLRDPEGLYKSQADPVGSLAAYFALDQARSLHPGQELGERHARARVADRGGQPRAGHPAGVEQLVYLCQVSDDVLACPHRALPGRLFREPHVSTLSPWRRRLPTAFIIVRIALLAG